MFLGKNWRTDDHLKPDVINIKYYCDADEFSMEMDKLIGQPSSTNQMSKMNGLAINTAFNYYLTTYSYLNSQLNLETE